MTDYQTAARMALKEKAIPLPDFDGKSVLDVGCDHGYWCWLAGAAGAVRVVGLDRGREVRGQFVNLAEQNLEMARTRGAAFEFYPIDLGKQWHSYGRFDVVLCFSMYHHVFENCGDHQAIWFWLWRHTAGQLLWENPTGDDDAVVRLNVSKPGYDRAAILRAAETYFEIEHIGPALHMPTREVWRCTPRYICNIWSGRPTSGGGGATLAFTYADSRRMAEIAAILGEWPYPGTLNLRLDALILTFDWDRNYFRAQMLDAEDRANLNGPWSPRWARFYPVSVRDVPAHVFRFEGEEYPLNYVELISHFRLRDYAAIGKGDEVWLRNG